jgi:hypothetical protein
MALAFDSVSGWLGMSGHGCSTVLFTPYDVLGAEVTGVFAAAFEIRNLETFPTGLFAVAAVDGVLVRVMKLKNPMAWRGYVACLAWRGV